MTDEVEFLNAHLVEVGQKLTEANAKIRFYEEAAERRRIRESVCSLAIDAYGRRGQMEKAVEELAELIVAIKHHLSGKNTIRDVATEVADVHIMVEQLTQIVSPYMVGKEIDAKIERLARKLSMTEGESA